MKHLRKLTLLVLLALGGLPKQAFAQIEAYEVLNQTEARRQQVKDSLELQEMRTKAKAGNSDIQFELGYMYRTGERPDRRSIQVAQDIGILNYYSNSFQVDYPQAFFWLSKSAKQANPRAENELGLLYEAGRGVEQNTDSAFYWYLRAAAHCLPEAQNNLARLYFFGEGVASDYQKSYAWASIAYENGNSMAERGLHTLREKLSEEELQEAEKLKKKMQKELDCE